MVGGIAKAIDGWLSGLQENGQQVSILSMLPDSEEIRRQINGLPSRNYSEDWLLLPPRRSVFADRFVPIRKFRSGIFRFKQKNLILQKTSQIIKTYQPDWVIFSVLNPLCCTALPLVNQFQISIRRDCLWF